MDLAYGGGTLFQLDLGLKPLLPEVASFSPTSGAVGTKVTVKGQHFIQVKSVTFGNGASATPPSSRRMS
ncbi:MAG: IPT/TIG domain-containing protein [Bryobacteraceae bacterium]